MEKRKRDERTKERKERKWKSEKREYSHPTITAAPKIPPEEINQSKKKKKATIINPK